MLNKSILSQLVPYKYSLFFFLPHKRNTTKVHLCFIKILFLKYFLLWSIFIISCHIYIKFTKVLVFTRTDYIKQSNIILDMRKFTISEFFKLKIDILDNLARHIGEGRTPDYSNKLKIGLLMILSIPIISIAHYFVSTFCGKSVAKS